MIQSSIMSVNKSSNRKTVLSKQLYIIIVTALLNLYKFNI